MKKRGSVLRVKFKDLGSLKNRSTFSVKVKRRLLLVPSCSCVESFWLDTIYC